MIRWGSGSAFNHGHVEGDNWHRVERYKTTEGMWFLLSSPEKTYLCCMGPYSSKEERDEAILNEVKKREGSVKLGRNRRDSRGRNW